MPYMDALKNTMLNAINTTPSTVTTNTVFVSAHTADPGTNGANEATGGSYARQGVNLAAGSAGARAATNQPVIPVPAGSYTHLGFWTLVSGGTFLGSVDIVDESFAGAGTLTVTSCTFSIT